MTTEDEFTTRACSYCSHVGLYKAWDNIFGEVPICACCLSKYVDDQEDAQKLRNECKQKLRSN